MNAQWCTVIAWTKLFASPEGFISVGTITKQFIHALNCVSWSFNAFGKFREHKKDYSCSWLGFEQPLRFFRALQTSCASWLDQTLWCALLCTRRYHLPWNVTILIGWEYETNTLRVYHVVYIKACCGDICHVIKCKMFSFYRRSKEQDTL